MYTKMEITGEIEVLTGMHIGGSAQFSAIGAIDSPVVRDVESDLPMIPGSSLKGKLRTLLARKYCEGLPQEPNKDPVEILRLFGSSEKNNMRRSRLLLWCCKIWRICARLAFTVQRKLKAKTKLIA